MEDIFSDVGIYLYLSHKKLVHGKIQKKIYSNTW